MTEMICRRCGEKGVSPTMVPPGKFHEYILKNICSSCWDEWKKMSVKVINEYKLTPFLPQHREVLEGEMKQFFGLTE